jgi:hypothetical protein
VFNDLAVQALGSNHPLAKDIVSRLLVLDATPPNTAGLSPVAPSARGGWCGDMELAVGDDGSLTRLRVVGKDSGGGENWASPNATLFALTYTTYNRKETWDTKVNLTAADAEDAVWHPTVSSVVSNLTAAPGDASSRCRVVIGMEFASKLHNQYVTPPSCTCVRVYVCVCVRVCVCVCVCVCV